MSMSKLDYPAIHEKAKPELIKGDAADSIREYLRDFPKYYEQRIGLVLTGEYGTGKSAIAALVIREARKIKIPIAPEACAKAPGQFMSVDIFSDGIHGMAPPFYTERLHLFIR